MRIQQWGVGAEPGRGHREWVQSRGEVSPPSPVTGESQREQGGKHPV